MKLIQLKALKGQNLVLLCNPTLRIYLFFRYILKTDIIYHNIFPKLKTKL